LEIADLKARVTSLERMVEKLTNPPPAVPREAVFVRLLLLFLTSAFRMRFPV